MPRAPSILCLSVALLVAASARSAEMPVIVNGNALARADKPPAASPPPSNVQLPKIVNLSSLAVQTPAADGKTSDSKAPVIVNQAPAPKASNAMPVRYVVDYNMYAASDYVRPVGYNSYAGYNGLYSGYSDYGYTGGFGAYAGYGMGSYGMGGYGGYGPAYGYAPFIADLRPPLVEVLATGVRANVGRLTSMPAVAAPVYGEVIGVYYSR
jgi:hypothetical protein